MIQKIVSPFGIEAWLVEDYAVPLLAVDFAFRGGSSQDPEGRPGLTKLMAALLDEGAGTLNDEAFQLRLEENAVELHFHVGRDQVAGSLRSLVDRKDKAFDLLRMAIQEPRFDEDAVERIRQSLLAQLRHEANDPNSMASRAFFGEMFAGHPYGHWPRGSVESIEAATRDEIAAQHRRLLAKDVLVVSIVGAIDAAEAAAMLDQVFGALPSKALRQAVEDIAPLVSPTRRVIDLDVPQTVLQFAQPGVKRHDPDYLAAYVMNHIFGGGSFSSRLFQKVREQKGLAYSVSTQLSPMAHSAFIGGGVSTRNDRAAESLEIIEAEMADIAASGPSEAELISAKKFITGSYALRFDSSVKIANQLTSMQTDGLGIDYIDRRNALVQEIGLDDVRRIGSRLFGGGQPFVVAVGRPTGL